MERSLRLAMLLHPAELLCQQEMCSNVLSHPRLVCPPGKDLSEEDLSPSVKQSLSQTLLCRCSNRVLSNFRLRLFLSLEEQCPWNDLHHHVFVH